MGRNYTTVIVKQGGLYVASVYELPGVKTQGSTPAEARRLLEAAVAQLGKSNQEFASRLKARSSRQERKQGAGQRNLDGAGAPAPDQRNRNSFNNSTVA